MLCLIFANEGLPDLPDDFLLPTARVVPAGGPMIAMRCSLLKPPVRGMSLVTGHALSGHGKPMGNGHLVAACVARRGDDVFRVAFGYFNTFGGNPVSMAAASAVLDVIEKQGSWPMPPSVAAYRHAAGRLPRWRRISAVGGTYAVELI